MAKLVLKKNDAVVSEYKLTENKSDTGQHALRLTNGTKTYYAKLDTAKPTDVKAIKVSNASTTLYIQKETVPLKTHWDILTHGLSVVSAGAGIAPSPNEYPEVSAGGYKNGTYQIYHKGNPWMQFHVTDNTITVKGMVMHYPAGSAGNPTDRDVYSFKSINDLVRNPASSISDYPKGGGTGRLQLTADWISN